MTRTAVKFGAFVAVCTAFTLLLASTIGNTSIPGLVGRGPSTYVVEASFADVSGLLVNDNVKIAGVPVGKVTDIEVERGRATVSMRIRSEHVLPSDTAASIRWRNLIGQRYVYLDPGSATTTLEPGARIEDTDDVIDLGELFNRLGPIVAAIDESKVNDFLDTVTAALDGNQASISQSLDDLAVVAAGLGSRDAAIGRLVENLEVVSRTIADRDAQIQTILTNLAALAQTFSDNTELLDAALVEIGAFNRDLGDVLTANVDEVDGILARLDRTLDTVEGEFGSVNLLLDRLDDAASGIFRTSRHGEFLNQTILCFSVTPPPCPSPLVTGLDPLVGASTSGSDYTTPVRSGGDAILALLGGTP